jgi:hypothetical protein
MASIVRNATVQPVSCRTSATSFPCAVPRLAIRTNTVLLPSPGHACQALRPRAYMIRKPAKGNSLMVAAALNVGAALPAIPTLETDEAPKSLSLSVSLTRLVL